ncbi:hypothetical protein [Mycolicibacterium austroafricanum]|uniref:hypothetical protein n=1 Tax=Mycolicibacterium austroafricanum TaxID=39687 RepID=UPI000CFA5847|nr:hypothetical protein [Mycolicibacterium austroafricanum]PQP39350.1 hypothetical protein C6A88_33460 [Mycolicibacterium austroafricanum]
MNLRLQRACDRIVQRNQAAFVELRRDVVNTVRRTAQLLEPVFEDPTEIHGQMHCTNVRGLLLKLRLDREGGLIGGGIQPTLRTHCGQGMSVVLTDPERTEMRVRKAPAEVFSEDRERLVVYPQAVGEQQLSFGPEFDEFACVPDSRWYVLWTLSQDAVQVPDVFLAAVTGMDDPSRTVVWASAPLPRVVAQQSGADDDFDDFGKPEEGSGSTDPA